MKGKYSRNHWNIHDLVMGDKWVKVREIASVIGHLNWTGTYFARTIEHEKALPKMCSNDAFGEICVSFRHCEQNMDILSIRLRPKNMPKNWLPVERVCIKKAKGSFNRCDYRDSFLKFPRNNLRWLFGKW